MQVYLASSPLGIINPEYATARFSRLVNIDQGRSHALFYDLAAEFAEFGGGADDANVITWLRGAAGVNRGTTTASDFIRAYTAAQIDARAGQSITPAQLQDASNSIATAVFNDIQSSNLELPSVHDIGEHDAQETIVSFSDDGLPNDRAIWSGNLLFPGLGDGSFFGDNFLEVDGDSYDLFVAAYATQTAGYLNFLGAGASSLFTIFSNAG